MADFVDKASSFLEELDKRGVSISNADGETAVICKDCVAVIQKSGDEVGVDFIHKRVNMEDYFIGFTQQDIEDFRLLEAITGGGDSE